MRTIAKQRAIIDRKAVSADLDEIAGRLDGQARRQAVLARLKASLNDGAAEVERRLLRTQSGTLAVAGQAFLMDQLLRVIHDYTLRHIYPVSNPTAGERLCVAAVGGYGRGELAPYSDIDLLFLTPIRAAPHVEQVVETMLYMLWDLGLKVGHATRTVDECLRRARADVTIRTSLLETRFVWGDRDLYTALKTRFADEVQAGTGPEYLEAKLAERDARHERHGGSRYVLEPNIKEGKGGLRDLHTLFWIGKYLSRVESPDQLVDRGVFTATELAKFDKARDFLTTLRCHMHYAAKRAEERLTFDLQVEIGRRMGYTDHAGTSGVERVMKHYYLVAKDVGDLTRILCAALEAEHKRRPRLSLSRFLAMKRSIDGFPIDGGRISVASETAFAHDPVAMLRLFHVAQEHALDIHPDALRLVTQNLRRIDAKVRNDPEANALFVKMLTSRHDPETTLRRLNEAGLFGRFVPDFGRVVAQMQYDMYHVYTVDEHTIFAIGILHRIEQGLLRDELPVASEIIHKVVSRRVLYIAVLLHDIAKGRPGDHSQVGAKIARTLCPRLGLTPEETETVAWLVLHHLLMSMTAQKRDLDDPKTIADFAEAVQSPERLRLLLVLTVADIRAVGPKTWTQWKANLLRQLYHQTMEALDGGLSNTALAGEQRLAAAVAALRDQAGELLPDISAGELEAFAASVGQSYWLAFDPPTIAQHVRMLREARRGEMPLAIRTVSDPDREVSAVTVLTEDQPGLLPKIAGALAIAGATIVDARIFTMTSGMALDIFTVQDGAGGVFGRPDRIARFASTLQSAIDDGLDLKAELDRVRVDDVRRRSNFEVSPRVLIDNNASEHFTVVEVNGIDQPGFLFRITSALAGMAIQITTARISTYGERVVDVFYVKDQFGFKITHPRKLDRMREVLLEAIPVPAARVPTGRSLINAAE